MNRDVRNANIEKVIDAICRHMKKEEYQGACACTKCLSDIAAMALNYLPPHYYVEAEKGDAAGSPWMMVDSAVQEAIKKVTANPGHPSVSTVKGRI